MSSSRRLRRSGRGPQYSVMAVGQRSPILVAMDAFCVHVTADGLITWLIGCLPDRDARSLQTCPIEIAARPATIYGRNYVQMGLSCPDMHPALVGDCLAFISARPAPLPDDEGIGYLVQINPVNPVTQILHALRVLGLSREISQMIQTADTTDEVTFLRAARSQSDLPPLLDVFSDRPEGWAFQRFDGN